MSNSRLIRPTVDVTFSYYGFAEFNGMDFARNHGFAIVLIHAIIMENQNLFHYLRMPIQFLYYRFQLFSAR